MASTIEDGKYYYIINTKAMTALNVLNAGPAGTAVVGATTVWWKTPRNSVWQAKSGNNNTWKFLNLETNTYMWFSDDHAMTKLEVWNGNQNRLQDWKLHRFDKSGAPTFFTIQNYSSSLFIDLVNGNPKNANDVVSQQGGTQDLPNQCWTFVQSNGDI